MMNKQTASIGPLICPQYALQCTLIVSLPAYACVAAASVKSVNTTDVVLTAPVCFTMKFVVVIALTVFPSHTQPVVAVGIVIVQAEPGVVPVPMLNAAVPLFAEIVAPEPPQPAPAIVGAVLLNNRFVIVMLVNLPVFGVVPPIGPGVVSAAFMSALAIAAVV